MKRLSFLLFVLMATLLQVAAQEERNYVGNTKPWHFEIMYTPSIFTKVKLHFKYHANSDNSKQDLLGRYSTELNGNDRFFINTEGGYFSAAFGDAYGSAKNVKLEEGAIYVLTLDKNQFTVDKDYEKPLKHDQVVPMGTTSFTLTSTIELGSADNADNRKTRTTAIDLYYCQIYEGDKLVHEYRPSEDSRFKYLLTDNCTGNEYICRENDKNYNTEACGHYEPCKDHKYSYLTEDTDGTLKLHCITCGVNYDINNWKQDEDLGLSTIDPYLDVQADFCDVGSEKIYVNATNQINQCWLINDDTKQLYNYTDFSAKPGNGVEMVIPQSEKTMNLSLVAELIVMKNDDKGSHKETQYAVTHFQSKPYHSIKGLAINEIANPDSVGIMHPNTEVKWYIEYPDDEDVMSSDPFVVVRSNTPDFVQYETVGSAYLSSVEKKETLSNGKTIGYFSVIDDMLEESELSYAPLEKPNLKLDSLIEKQIDSIGYLSEYDKLALKGFYSHPSKRVYYQVYRGTTQSMWPSHRGKFIVEDSLATNNTLPAVTKINVIQDNNWSENKNVTVRVEMQNPYPWEYNEMTDPAGIRRFAEEKNLAYRRYRWDENAEVVISRYSPADDHNQDKSDAIARTFTIRGKDVQWDAEKGIYYAELQDCQSLPYTHYYYNAKVDGSDAEYLESALNEPLAISEEEANMSYSKTAALIGNFTASRDLVGKVNVRWSLGTGSVDKLVLERREYSVEGNKAWEPVQIANADEDYTDTKAQPGHVEEYRLTASFVYRGKTYSSEATALGYPTYRGKLAGRVVMPNGVGIEGAEVVITRKSPDYISIEDVYDADGNLVMKGTQEGIIADAPIRREADEITAVSDTIHGDPTSFRAKIKTDKTGAFELDNVLFSCVNGVSTQYEISVTYGTNSFNYAGKNQTALIALNNSQPERTGITFTCSTYKRVSGNVYYAKSTVPVRDITFDMTFAGTTTKFVTADGEPVKTDANGYFAILVPYESNVKVQMQKDGHKFENDGYIVGTAEEAIKLDPNHSYDDGKYYDFTKTRLVGRLCGGNVEARKQLGFSHSKNNLGDNPTIVLQLEGDNSALLVYDVDHPEITQDDKTFDHPYAGLYTGYQPQTSVSYQRKRIVIKPDPKTGEFFVDLFPTKYKVTQLSAEGYSTLYTSGEGFDVIDFSDSIATRTIASKQDASQKVELEASYVRVYHKPATVTYEQFKYGQKTGYLGDAAITEMNLNGQTNTATIATYDAGKKKADYLFGYPVFSTGVKYTMQVRAHEDYYYNNEESNTLDEVHLDGGTLIVQNGLLSNNAKTEHELDSMGIATIVFQAGNTTFRQSGEDALRCMNVSVKLNDYYYEANPLKAFVTGYRDKGTDFIAFDNDVTVVDVLRDPYGAGSYSWMEKGASYEWNHDYDWSINASLTITPTIGSSANTTIGAFMGIGGGAFAGQGISTSVTYSLPLDIPIVNYAGGVHSRYTMTTNEKITTSADPRDIGAMADVYIGTVHTAKLNTKETFSVIDQTTYEAVKGAINRGTVRVIKSGVDKDGKQFHLVIGDKIALTVDDQMRQFAYSQKYIVGTLIPNLIDTRDNLLIYAQNRDSIVQLSKESKEVKYWSKVPADHAEFGLSSQCEMINESGREAINEVERLNKMIKRWAEVIQKNEQTKIDHMDATGDDVTPYSIAGTAIDYSEKFSSYYVPIDVWSVLGINTKNGNLSYGATLSGGVSNKSGKWDTNGNYSKKVDDAIWEGSKGDQSELLSHTDGPGWKISFQLTPKFGFNVNNKRSYSKVSNASRGYHIAAAEGSSFNMDVVKVINKDIEKEYLMEDEEVDYAADGKPSEVKDKKISDFLFYLRGGAVRNPYFYADSTVYLYDGKRVMLGTNPKKMDIPKLFIDRPIVSNMPEDEKAVFTLHMSNDGETGLNTQYVPSTKFTLYVNDNTNPNGAKFSIDGEPLTGGRDFFVNPGQTLTKTLEVERGVGYDFQNIQLVLRDANVVLSDKANISINYLPMASKVNISSPTDKWVMNTLSATDDKGRYYIPVNIDGFNVHSDGFHHIELQYKKQTEGDSQWVTVRSFYNDSTLFAQATGTKEMIPSSGKIGNVKFYGEKDPMEMKYDLRAVAFRALGTGYATRASNVMTGIKDTRCPEVFGLPKPADGILGYDDVISIPFNEPIAYNYLNKTSNFQVVGYLNDFTTSYATSLHFSNTPTDAAGSEGTVAMTDSAKIARGLSALGDVPTSKIYRNLTGNDFTIDLMAELDSDDDTNIFFVMTDTATYNNRATSDSYMTYLYSKKQFIATINGITFRSEPIGNASMKGNLTHVGLAVKQTDSSPEVSFYIGDTPLQTESITNANGVKIQDASSIDFGNIKGIIMLGGYMSGNMVDVRLWNKAMSLGEFMSKKSKILSKAEPSLFAYWPMDEGKGNVLFDRVNGCDLHFAKSTWQMPDGQHSLLITGKPVNLDNKATVNFANAEYDDFTLTFWFKVNEKSQISDAKTISLFKAGDETESNYLQVGVKDKSLMLTCGKNVFTAVTSDDLCDGWHNMALIVNKSQNTSSMYYDGMLTTTFPCDKIGGMSNHAIAFGDDNFYGNIDNFMLWNLAFPSNCINAVYNAAPTGYEMGLEYFLPFETEQTVNGTYKTEFSPYNMKYNEVIVDGEPTGKWAIDGTDMFGLSEEAIKEIDDDILHCPIHPATGLSNIPFTWTASDNELQINIKKADREINHQDLYITVRNVEDLQGNVLVNPQMMSVYVNKNILVWDGTKAEGQIDYVDRNELLAFFKNLSGKNVSYNIVENCSWLDIDDSHGTIAPQEEKYLELKVAKGLAPGEYETTIYLVDEHGLSAPLPVRATVNATIPDWFVTDDEDYKYTMNVMGQVKLTNSGGAEYFDTDERDIIGAFYNNVCVGLANITKNDAGTPYVYLTIKGNESMLPTEHTKKTISFRIWSASTNMVTLLKPQVDNEAITFNNNAIYGCPPNKPIIFKPNNEIMQIIPISNGWNWISFNINVYNDRGVNQLFYDEGVFTPGDKIVHVNDQGMLVASVFEEDPITHKRGWSGGIDAINNWNRNVYQIYMQYPATLVVNGTRIEDDDRYVTLKTRSKDPMKGKWNDLAYLLEVDQPIQTAMSDYSKDRSIVGTVIKSISEFAVADENGKWVGSLDAMHPGMGYYTKFMSKVPNDTIKIMYTNNDIFRNAKPRESLAKTRAMEEDESLDLTLIQGANHNNNMPVIAAIGEGIEYEDGDEIIAYADGEMVGSASQTVLDNGEKLFFISVNSEQGSSVRFALIRDGEVISKSSNGITYDADAVCGTLDMPFAIDFTGNAAEGDVYDINGIKYNKAEDVKTRKGVFIINGQKKLNK